MQKRAIIYARLSPTPRGEDAKGGNLDQQVDLCRRRCDAESWAIVETVTEKDTSATSNKPRKGWQRVVRMVRNGEADIIVSRHYDRMYRKVADLTELIALTNETGVDLVATEAYGQVDLSTATGRGNAYFMAVGAQLETEIKAERQKLGHQRRVEAGRPFWGTRPFGFEKDGTHRQAEAEMLRAAYSDLLAGHSLYGIAARWNEAGVLSPKGNPWRSSNLRSVIKHPRNAGIHTYTPRRADQMRAGEFGTPPAPSGYDATWEPIVSRDIYEAVCTLLADPSRSTHGGGKRKGLLTNLARCSKCGEAMGQVWNRPRADGSRLRKYMCRECRGTGIAADFLEDYVINQIVFRADKIVAAKLANDDAGSGLNEDEIAALRAEEVRLKRRKQELGEDYSESLIDRDTLRAGVRRADERLAQIADTINDAVVNRVSADRWRRDVEAMFYALDQLDDPTHHDELREIITDATVWVKVLPRGKGKRQAGPEDVDIKFIAGIEDDGQTDSTGASKVRDPEAEARLSAVFAEARAMVEATEE